MFPAFPTPILITDTGRRSGMRRRALLAVACAGMMLLAGCSYSTTTGVAADVTDVTERPNGGYELTVSAKVVGVERAFHDVRLYGYTLDGEHVCTTQLGKVDNTSSATMECAELPSLLVPATRENGTVEIEQGFFDTRPNEYYVRHNPARYAGFVDGTHRYTGFEAFEWNPNPRDGYTVEGERPVPSNATFESVSCHQWQDGRDFSELQSASWRHWDSIPAAQSPQHHVAVWNLSKSENRGYDRIPDRPETPRGNASRVYTADETPRPIFAARLDNRGYGTQPLSNKTLLLVLNGLSDSNITEMSDVPLAVETVDGYGDQYDNQGTYCQDGTPVYRGSWGYEAKITFLDSNVEHVAIVRAKWRYSGPAVTKQPANSSQAEAT